MNYLKNKKNALIILTLPILIGAAGVFYFKNGSNAPHVNTSVEEQHGAPPTYKAESEGQKFDVPESVPKESIKNYRLITENEQFKIRKLDDSYTITLYAIINRPDQYDLYRDQLSEFKQNALNYLRENNINPDRVNIVYEPEEARDL